MITSSYNLLLLFENYKRNTVNGSNNIVDTVSADTEKVGNFF